MTHNVYLLNQSSDVNYKPILLNMTATSIPQGLSLSGNSVEELFEQIVPPFAISDLIFNRENHVTAQKYLETLGGIKDKFMITNYKNGILFTVIPYTQTENPGRNSAKFKVKNRIPKAQQPTSEEDIHANEYIETTLGGGKKKKRKTKRGKKGKKRATRRR